MSKTQYDFWHRQESSRIKATGALTTPLHFSRLTNTQNGQSTGFDYTRTKNPTRATAEKTLAAIEGRPALRQALEVSHCA